MDRRSVPVSRKLPAQYWPRNAGAGSRGRDQTSGLEIDVCSIWGVKIQATIYQDEMDNSLDDKPLILQADSWRRFREDSFLIPNSLRSVDQSARGEIITLPFED